MREQHRLLDGITLPPSDKFWDEFFPPNGWNCFVPGTPVLTPDGWKAIETIGKGDLVIGGSGKYRVVIGVHATPVDDELISIRSKRLVSTSTKNHRYLTSRGWVAADGIQLGDIIIQVAESSLQQKFINAVHNSSVILRQLFMSLIRERKSGTTFAVDNQVQFRHVKISNKITTKPIARKFKMFINQHLEDLHFCRGQRLSQRTHSLGVSFARSKRGLQGFIPYFRTKKGRFLLELIGNLANQLAILFVFSLSYMLSLPCKAAICFCKAFAGFSSSLIVVKPLRFNGFSSMSDWYSAVFKNFCYRSVINSPCFTQPSITSHLCEIPELCGIDNIHSFNGFNSFYNFLRKTFLHCTYNLVTGKNTKKHATIVYNLSVNRDESYIIPIGITHNCRCTAVQVNPKRYPESNSEEAIQRGRAATFQPNAKGQNKAQIFRFNPGKQKVIFPPKHPYLKAPEAKTDIDKLTNNHNIKEARAHIKSRIKGFQLNRPEFGGKTATAPNSSVGEMFSKGLNQNHIVDIIDNLSYYLDVKPTFETPNHDKQGKNANTVGFHNFSKPYGGNIPELENATIEVLFKEYNDGNIFLYFVRIIK